MCIRDSLISLSALSFTKPSLQLPASAVLLFVHIISFIYLTIYSVNWAYWGSGDITADRAATALLSWSLLSSVKGRPKTRRHQTAWSAAKKMKKDNMIELGGWWLKSPSLRGSQSLCPVANYLFVIHSMSNGGKLFLLKPSCVSFLECSSPTLLPDSCSPFPAPCSPPP